VASGMTYQWYSSPTGAGGSFTAISGATNPVYMFSGLISNTYYNCIVTCPTYGSSTSSNVLVTSIVASAACTPSYYYTYGPCSYGMYLSPVVITGDNSILSVNV
jgi:hypothetical protein